MISTLKVWKRCIGMDMDRETTSELRKLILGNNGSKDKLEKEKYIGSR